MRRRLGLVAAAALLLAPAAHAARPTPSAVFGLRAVGNPKVGYFVYDLGHGATQSGAVIVSNVGTRTGTARLYAVDATTGATTGTVYVTDRAPRLQGRWVSLAQSHVTLAPGKHARVAFTVHVPRSAKPGQWVAGIVAENVVHRTSRRTKGRTGVRINVRDLTIVAVQVNVPGRAVASFAVGGITAGGSNGYQTLLVHLANTGNLLRKPGGTVSISNGHGAVERLPFHMDTFLPQTAIDYPLLLRKALAPGSYTATVRLSFDSAGGRARTTTAVRSFAVSNHDVTQVFTSAAPTKPAPGTTSGSSRSSTPWLLIGALAGAGVLVLLLVAALLRSRRRPSAESAAGAPIGSSPAPAADTAAVADLPARTEPEPPPAADMPAPADEPAFERADDDCRPYHYWEVAYDRGELGGDGVWRFPHRCRNCGLEVLAENVDDAAAQTARAPQPS
ncbi:MAG TPA: DUF916 domain-containing protein [Gaiellaceae bacterium]|nr:DUF916 domain-containing protein [Gaiellaceae bacterium]